VLRAREEALVVVCLTLTVPLLALGFATSLLEYVSVALLQGMMDVYQIQTVLLLV
jgi:hypothetical protein